ncbi:gas vesicle accessory protein GvpU [Metabacillus litoralis]|uniref:gas vesicle accessory protein GvpU n=1 Tax=Metabacillus litoralis TaxID=152268 RepID=UPI001CFC9FDE|nr:gas vesicle accessory protein GvpU [Metabacillus litoralis]
MAKKNKEQDQQSTDDAIILMFLDLVEKDGIELDLTLSINGVVVSGTLISATTYYEGVTEASKELHDGTMSKIIAKKFSDLKEEYAKQKEEEEESESSPLTFIHLKNATYLNNGIQLPPNHHGTWWRGRIASIDGFSVNDLK